MFWAFKLSFDADIWALYFWLANCFCYVKKWQFFQSSGHPPGVNCTNILGRRTEQLLRKYFFLFLIERAFVQKYAKR
jgi:hypothetical protein